jgi:hypothetical protein
MNRDMRAELFKQLKENEKDIRIFNFFMDYVRGEMELFTINDVRNAILSEEYSGIGLKSFIIKFELDPFELHDFFENNSLGMYKDSYVVFSSKTMNAIEKLINNFSYLQYQLMKGELREFTREEIREINHKLETDFYREKEYKDEAGVKNLKNGKNNRIKIEVK